MRAYFCNFFTLLGYTVGVTMYLAYALPTAEWSNPWLICVSVFVGVFLPSFARLSDWSERLLTRKSGSVFTGRIARLACQLAFNTLAISALASGGVIHAEDLQPVGGAVGAIFLMSFASQGAQLFVIELANRDLGNRYANVTFALCCNVIFGALAAVGIPAFQVIFVAIGIGMGCFAMLWSLLTDVASLLAPPGGIGVFFGTFNPVHRSHMRILRHFIESRRLSKVYIHPTVVPAFYRSLLEEGVITIVDRSGGMRRYALTGRRKRWINYFPTGNEFYEARNRVAMLRAAVDDEGLGDRVEVLFLPEIYSKSGFRGVIDYVRTRHPRTRLHGLHGSDAGGALVRTIYDRTRMIWPKVAIRSDLVSSTAIRRGAEDMTYPSVDRIRAILADPSVRESSIVSVHGFDYRYRAGQLIDDCTHRTGPETGAHS